ncbi:NAD(P)-dependent alcohol dehydrogenase [Candidatus Lucifugimonas marina]|uniref:Zinc-binding dehydrogenase n=1 Tax=Candidatus Lucifugimonas marina TaxID=3038979 RepID=A0AAJ5ZJ33_9CHLR|nr:zinc-binding dehydrogenase [SAR202 cluster bacterium JH702]MDG0869110.1 zinc-binding dehydrogenase [SAR202 cluster bacterium JH639]WFG35730.1 zinc-binding dehydrogenase [SAR202 cluster bacterium JH545]WFG39676.1 zinc-binding dehydrogenase [SAR202 cluster bacterium JH1073]
MKAIVYRKYGSPDVLSLEEVEMPIPRDDEVLIKIHATSLNSYDVDLLKGWPFLSRIFQGLRKPKNKILGTDVAGTVEAVGSDVTKLRPGDEVFGEVSTRFISLGFGGFAEYVCAREKNMTLKPSGMTFEEASAIPQVASLALGALRQNGEIQPGQKILMNGAGGGVGTFVVQLGKHFGAEVTGVDGTEKIDMLHSIGTDHVIDYTKEDFTNNGERYDLIIDVAAHRSVFRYKRSLNPGGAYGAIGGSVLRFFQAGFVGPLITLFGNQKIGTSGGNPNDGMDLICALFEAGKVKPVIDRTYPLVETPQAFCYFMAGHVKGKVVITM